MFTGKRLGKAIKEAIELKIASGSVSTKTEIARTFKVKPPSIYDWMNSGSISKDKLPFLFGYFSDVVEMDHWGLSPQISEQRLMYGEFVKHAPFANKETPGQALAAYILNSEQEGTLKLNDIEIINQVVLKFTTANAAMTEDTVKNR